MVKNTRLQALALVVLGVLLSYGAATTQFGLNWFAQAVDREQPAPARHSGPPLAVVAAVGEHNQKAVEEATQTGKKPNIVFIFADNLGYGEIG